MSTGIKNIFRLCGFFLEFLLLRVNRVLLFRWEYPGEYPATMNTIIYFSTYLNVYIYWLHSRPWLEANIWYTPLSQPAARGTNSRLHSSAKWNLSFSPSNRAVNVDAESVYLSKYINYLNFLCNFFNRFAQFDSVCKYYNGWYQQRDFKLNFWLRKHA